MSNYENERDMWSDIVRADSEDRAISGRSIRRVGVPPGGNFGQGPALEKNESGRGYHVKGAPGFEDDEGPTREQEEGMGFERALWLKSGPNPRRR